MYTFSAQSAVMSRRLAHIRAPRPTPPLYRRHIILISTPPHAFTPNIIDSDARSGRRQGHAEDEGILLTAFRATARPRKLLHLGVVDLHRVAGMDTGAAAATRTVPGTGYAAARRVVAATEHQRARDLRVGAGGGSCARTGVDGERGEYWEGGATRAVVRKEQHARFSDIAYALQVGLARGSPSPHHPTFERALADGLHHTNDAFAALLVCARHAPRPGAPERRLPRFPQVYTFSALSLLGIPAPISPWTPVGVGIRSARDVAPTAASRLFFDLDLPIDCDDEYGATRRLRGSNAGGDEQPTVLAAGSTRTGGDTRRRIRARPGHYAINKPKFLLGLSNNSKTNDGEWGWRIVRELADALDKWAKELPDHLNTNISLFYLPPTLPGM
ncbi:hypothetical protein C8J57DRAFT_1253377 [Mycena rebaudengoi]|nr:hypothetical protein C8J57DRAFT_1253377 [Mycena rebaudengoi]